MAVARLWVACAEPIISTAVYCSGRYFSDCMLVYRTRGAQEHVFGLDCVVREVIIASPSRGGGIFNLSFGSCGASIIRKEGKIQ